MFPKRRKSNFTAKCLDTFVAHCSLQNRRDFLRTSGEQGRKRGEREARVACVGRFAKKSRLSAYHCSSSSAPRHTLNDQPVTVLEKQW